MGLGFGLGLGLGLQVTTLHATLQVFTDFFQRVLNLNWIGALGVSFVKENSPLRLFFLCDLDRDPESARFLQPIKKLRRVTSSSETAGADPNLPNL